MPITKSAKKQLRQNLKKKGENDSRKKKMKELLKKANILIKEGKKEEVTKMLPSIYKAIDKAAKTNILKKNTASRRKAGIAKKLNIKN
jgi:small subunit ribosomal protein S20